MTYTETVVNNDLRARVFEDVIFDNNDEIQWVKVNDRQYGCLMTDLNGVTRYVRLGAIVAEEREDMSAQELMQSEVAKYNEAQKKKAEKKRNSEEKAKRDKALREKKAKEKEEGVA